MKSYKLYSEETGKGETILLIPGLIATTKFWTGLIDEIDNSRRTISVDLLGFGLSPKPKHINYSIEEHIESIKRTLDDKKTKLPIIIVGHSMGTLLATAFCARHPNYVKKLLLISPPIFKDAKEARKNIKEFSAPPPIVLYGNTAKIVCRIFCNFLRPVTTRAMYVIIRDLPKDVIAGSLLHSFESYSRTLKNVIEDQEFSKDLEKITIPTAIIYGNEDKRVIKENLKSIKKRNPEIKLHELPGHDHFIPIRNPKEVARFI